MDTPQFKMSPGLASMYDWTPQTGLTRKLPPAGPLRTSPFMQPQGMGDGLPYMLGKGLRSYLTNTPLQGIAGGPRTAGSLMGLAAGLGLGGLKSWADPMAPVSVPGYGLAGALSGWLLGGLNGLPNVKQSSFGAPDAGTIMRLIQQLDGLPPNVQQQMIQATSQLSPGQRATVYRMLGAAAGATGGLAVAQYYSSMGLIPSVIGMLIGGILGAGLGHAASGRDAQPPPDNSFMFRRGNNPSPGISRLIYGP